MIGYNEAMDRMEQRLAEIESENWFPPNISDYELPIDFNYGLFNNNVSNDLPSTSREDGDDLFKAIFENDDPHQEYRFYGEMDNESDHHQESFDGDRLLAGSSWSSSQSLINEHQGRSFFPYRRYSYPIIGRDFTSPDAIDEGSDEEIGNLSNLMRLGLTTSDESSSANTLSHPTHFVLQPRIGNPVTGGDGYCLQYESSHSLSSEKRSLVRSRRRTRRAVKRYHTHRSQSESACTSTKRRRSVTPVTRRRINAEYTSSETDEEPVEEVSYFSHLTQQDRTPRSRLIVRRLRTSRRRSSQSLSPRRNRRLSSRSRIFGRLRSVSSSRITRR
uniref:BZIP domain-containing protein n=1 Tax=Elaeophora elaphi TaxID=1147741 RepID=A0A0R3RXX7_9BILA